MTSDSQAITAGPGVGAPGLRLRPGDQPLPTPNEHPDIQSLVMRDLEARRQLGISRYGTALQPRNGRDMLQDAYDEAMDLTVYLKGALEERRLSRLEHTSFNVAVAPDNGLGSGHRQVTVSWADLEATVDYGMVEDILTLWKAGFPTSYSCQGGIWGDGEWGERYVVVNRGVSDAELDELVVLLPWATDVDPRSFSFGKSIVRLSDGAGHWKSLEQLEDRIAMLRRHQERYAAALQGL